MSWLIWLYPRAWRQRYGAEFAALLERQRPTPRVVSDVLRGAWDAHCQPPPIHEPNRERGQTMPAYPRGPRWALLVAVLGVLGVFSLVARPPFWGGEPPWAQSSPIEGPRLVLQADLSGVPATERADQLHQLVLVLERRVQVADLAGVHVQPIGADRVRIDLPAGADLLAAAQLLTGRGQLDFREQAPLPDGGTTWVTARVPGRDGQARELGSQYFTRVTPSAEPSTDRALLLFELDGEGQQLLAALTQRLVGQRLGIFVDDQLYMARTVRDPVEQGRGQITGQLTPDSARTLAIQLRAGVLPVPVQLVEAAIS
jgi:hypothetical protein